MEASSADTPRTEREPSGPRSWVEAAGARPDEAMATLPGVYAGKHWYSRPTDHPYSFRHTAVGDDTLTLRRSHMQGYIRGEVPPGGDYVVQWLTSGSLTLDLLHHPDPLPLMRPQLSPQDQDFVFEAADYDMRLVHLNRALVHEVATELAGGFERAVRLDPRARPAAAALVRWRDALAGATAVITG